MHGERDNGFDREFLRGQIIGIDTTFATPFGERLMVYCDYTASGRCLHFVEAYLKSLQGIYANTHTEDDVTGRSMSQLLHQAEASIKNAVNAGPDGRIIACGTGATGAIDKLQQIVGVALAPATRQALEDIVDVPDSPIGAAALNALLETRQPVVFVGPYEHHSNEISWRHSLATTIEVGLDDKGDIDLADLERLLRDERYVGRLRIGSFSAASNVTGRRSDVRAIASLLHAHDALACFDYAACAPYVDIDMNPAPAGPGDDPRIDAVFISPHKFLGGPGSSGVLVFNQRIYHRELPPSVSAGGTVDYVGMHGEDFIADIEEREKAGTPGVLQTLKAALVFEIRDRIGTDEIEAREQTLTARAMRRFGAHAGIEILGDPDPARRIGIIAFNIRTPSGRYLHHRFVTVLLNDLFGIQSRAGCSCAGPYGHRLLGIGEARSGQYRAAVNGGHCGIKPGWCRIGLHWTMDDIDADYVIDAVEFIADYGDRFLDSYDFDLASGTWQHRSGAPPMPDFSLDAAVATRDTGPAPLPAAARRERYRHYLDEAQRLADGRDPGPATASLADGLRELQFFALPGDYRS